MKALHVRGNPYNSAEKKTNRTVIKGNEGAQKRKREEILYLKPIPFTSQPKAGRVFELSRWNDEDYDDTTTNTSISASSFLNDSS